MCTLVCVVQSKSVLLNLLLRFDHHPCTEEMPESEYESLSDQFRYVLRKTLAEIPRHILANDCIPQKKKKKKKMKEYVSFKVVLSHVGIKR